MIKEFKDELSDNLSNLLKNGKPSFGIHGYENTVIPDLERLYYQNITSIF